MKLCNGFADDPDVQACLILSCIFIIQYTLCAQKIRHLLFDNNF